MHAGGNEEKRQTFFDGMNRDAPGLGRGGGLGFFFRRGSWGGADKSFGFRIGCSFVCGGGIDFPAPVTNAVVVAVPFVPRSDDELVEATRLTGSFVASLGLINSGI